MEKLTHLIKEHPMQSVLLGGVAIIALLYIYGKTSGGSTQSSSDNGAAQNAYFNAENIQAQTGAAVQIANINASASTANTQLTTAADVANNTTWAAADTSMATIQGQTATAALPYAEESTLIDALAGISTQTQTTTSKSNGFFGIGGSNKTVTSPTANATTATDFLAQLVNGLYPAT